MSRSTLTCGQVNAAPERSRNLLPAMRMTSATSQGGRVTKVYPRTAADVPGYESRVDRVDQSRSAGDGAKDANRRSYAPGVRVQGAAEWSADRSRPPCGAWQNCGAECAAQSFSGCRHER